MAQRIEVPGHGLVEFPDGMDDAAIVQAIKGLGVQQPRAATPQDLGIGGAMKAGLVAAGRSADRILDGLTQKYLDWRGESSASKALAGGVAEKDRLFKPVQEQFPTATAVGHAVPAMTVPVGGAGASALGFIGRSAAAGAAPGLLEYGSDEERAKRGVTGALGGAVGGSGALGLARLLKPVGTPTISPQATGAAERLGMNLTAGQRTQNPALMNLENYLARSPGASGVMQRAGAANQGALNRAAASAMGQQGGDLSEAGFSAAKNAIGAEFDRLGAITAPKIGDEFLSALSTIDAANAAKGSFRSKSIDSLIDKGIDLAAKGEITGTAYKQIRTQLSNDAQAAFKAGDASLGQALKTVRSSLDDAAAKSLSPADQKAWGLAREQWAAYKALTKGNVAEAGDVSAARVAASLRRGGDQFRTGTMNGPLADIGRVGEAVKGVQNPNSGNLVSQMMFGNPLTGIPMAAANRGAASLYMSPGMQNYLARGLLDVGDGGRLAIGRAAEPFGIAGLQGLLGAQ